MAELQVIQEGAQYWLRCAAHRFRCVVGAAGLIAANNKQEGDNATPRGRWPLRGYITGLTGLPLTGWPAIRPSVRLRSANRMAGVMILRMPTII